MLKKETKRKRRHGRVRKKISGTPDRPRLSVHRSLKNISVQLIDDTKSQTLYSCSSLNKDFIQAAGKKTAKTACAEKLGSFTAEKIKEKGIKKIAFDRGGYQYHGRVKALAESLRQAGIEF